MSSPASTAPAALPTDPLEVLGPELFVEVLSFLSSRDLLVAERVSRSWNDCSQAYSCGLWRRICLAEGIEPADIKACDALGRKGRWTVGEHDKSPIASDVASLLAPPTLRDWAARIDESPTPYTPATPMDTPVLETARVNWRYVCKTHKDLQNAWSIARCRLRWITPPTNTVWRIKSNVEQDVILCTSRMRMSGLTTVCRNTSEPLFAIRDLEGYSHVEAGRGFAVFNTPGHVDPMAGLQFDDDNTLEVWRTAEARARSTLPYLGTSSVAQSAVSFTHPDEFEAGARNGFLPRGHMEHFRTLQPPATCLAFRLHVAEADTDRARAVFAACGREAIFIWHLEEEKPMDKITRGYLDKGRPNYIELDDNFVFVCLDRQMHVYSRATGKHCVSFPPVCSAARDTASLAFPLSLAEDFKAIPNAERVRANPGPTDDGVPAHIGRAVVQGAYRGQPGFDEAILRGLAMHPIRIRADENEDIEYGFTACHFTPTNLVCTARSGAVFIVRNYRDVLHQALKMPEVDRAPLVAQNTFIVGLGTTIRQLTTYRHHIVICTSFNVILLEGNQLPDLPKPGEEPEGPAPFLRAHVLLGNHPQAMKMSSCIQADARSIYLTYWATGEMDARGLPDPSNTAFPTDDALEGFGMCIKTWTFGLD